MKRPRGCCSPRRLQEPYSKLCRFSQELRTAISLREFDGLSYDEIAQVMACPVGTVRSRIFRAREAIDKRLGTPDTLTTAMNTQHRIEDLSAFLDEELSSKDSRNCSTRLKMTKL